MTSVEKASALGRTLAMQRVQETKDFINSYVNSLKISEALREEVRESFWETYKRRV